MPSGNEQWANLSWPISPVQTDIQAVLAFFQIARPTFTIWRDSQCPVEPDGRFHLHKLLLWRLRSRGLSSQNEADLKAEKLKIQNAVAMLDLAERQGELVNRRDAKASMAALFHRIRERLQAMPAELATMAPVSQRADFLADAQLKIRQLLKEMESWAMPATLLAPEPPENADAN